MTQTRLEGQKSSSRFMRLRFIVIIPVPGHIPEESTPGEPGGGPAHTGCRGAGHVAVCEDNL